VRRKEGKRKENRPRNYRFLTPHKWAKIIDHLGKVTNDLYVFIAAMNLSLISFGARGMFGTSAFFACTIA